MSAFNEFKDLSNAFADIFSNIFEFTALVEEVAELTDLPPPLVDYTDEHVEVEEAEEAGEGQNTQAGEAGLHVSEDIQAIIQHILQEQALPQEEVEVTNEAIDPAIMDDIEAAFWAALALSERA